MPSQRRTLTDYHPPLERHFEWSREWGEVSRAKRVALCAWALALCPALTVSLGFWVPTWTGANGIISVLGLAIAFISTIALVAVPAVLTRLQSYAVTALTIGALIVSAGLYLGFLMWIGAHGAFA